MSEQTKWPYKVRYETTASGGIMEGPGACVPAQWNNDPTPETAKAFANLGFAQGVFSQQARMDAEKKVYVDHVSLLQGKVRELEVELEARKKAWKEVKAWATKTRDGAIGETGTSLYFNEFVEKLTALETAGPTDRKES